MPINKEVPNIEVEETPQQSADNIAAAESHGTTPDGYVGAKEQFDTAAYKPIETSPAVAREMAQSTQHQNIIKEDVEKLNWMERQVRYGSLTIKGKDITNELFSLSSRRAFGEQLSEEEDFKILELNSQLQELNGDQGEFKYDFSETVPSEVLGGVYDFAHMLGDSYDLVLQGGVAGAGIGLALGSATLNPLGAAIGPLIGAQTGAMAGVSIGFLRNAYRQTTGQIYNDLTFAIPETKDLPERTKRQLAVGGGLVSGLISLIPGGALVKNTPFLKRIATPRSFMKYLATAEGGALKGLVMQMAKSGMAESIEEGAQEVVTTIATEVGKTWDGTETSFVTGMTNALKDPETFKQAGKAAFIGGLVGGGIQGGINIATAPLMRDSVPTDVPPVPLRSDLTAEAQIPLTTKGVRAIQMKMMLDQSTRITENTTTKDLAPKSLDQIRKKMYEDAGTSTVWVDKEELAAWADSDEKAALAREMIGPEGIAASEINSPLRIETHKFLKIADDFPEITNIAKPDPSGPSTMSYILRLRQADEQRTQILGEIGGLEATPEQKQAIEDTPMSESDVFGEESLLEQQSFTEDMSDVIPAKEIDKLNHAENVAKDSLLKAVDEDKIKGTENVIGLQERYQVMLNDAEHKAKHETPEKILVVEDFLDNSRVIEGEEKPGGKPVHAIDPALLTDRLRNKYADDPVLKFRKVFSKDGMIPEDVASIYDAESVEDFLELMANTPTTEEKSKSELDTLNQEIEEELEGPDNLESSAMVKAYDKISKIHLKNGKTLQDKYWPTLREDVKRVPLDIPKLEKQLSKRAKETVGATVIDNLSVDQGTVAARRSQTQSTEAFRDGRLEDGLKQKQNAAYANQLVKETRIANSKVNSAMKYIAKLATPRYEAILKNAGKSYFESVKFFTDVYNFNPVVKEQGDIEQYKKYIKEQNDMGNGNEAIPPERLAWLDPRETAGKLTVDQLLYIHGKLRSIVKQAEMKNKTYRKDDKRSVEMVSEDLHDIAVDNPDYDIEKVERPAGVIPFGYNLANSVSATFESLLNNNQFIIQELDQGVLAGPYAKVLHFPITGVGQYEGPTGMVANAKLMGVYSKRFAKSVTKHFKSWTEFKNYAVEVVTVEEFKDLPGFKTSKGKVSKDQLLMILANMGNAENRAYVKNFGIEPDAMLEILQKHLGERDFDFVQDAMWNGFKSLAPRLDAVEKSTTGNHLDFVEPESFQAFGKNYEGGYFPIILDREISLKEAADNFTNDLKAMNPVTAKPDGMTSPAYEGIVRSPHTKERKGSQHTLSLDMNRFSRALDDTIYDITMREPIRDVMTLLHDKQIKEDIIAQVGRIKYNTMVNNVANLTKSASSNNLQLHSALQTTLGNTFAKIEGAFAVNYIAFNMGSVLMSSLAVPQVALKMGSKNFAKHMSKVALKVGGAAATFNTKAFSETFALAAEIDPSLQLYRQGIEDSRASTLAHMLPKKRLVANKTYNSLKRLQEGAIEFAFSGILGGLDVVIKMQTTVAVYNMYLAGDAPGHSYESVHAGKTPEEINMDAKAYTSQFLENTTMRASQYDKSVLQNSSMGKMFTRFWNEARNQFNNVLQERRNLKADVRKMVEKTKAGDIGEANVAFQDAGGRMMTLFGVMMASQMLMNFARYGAPFIIPDDEDDPRDADTSFEAQLKAMPKFFGYQVTNPIEVAHDYLGSSTPIYRDMVFSAKSADMTAVPRRSVSVPLMSAKTDFATAGNVVGLVYSDIMDGASLMEAMDNLTPQESKAFLNSVGYLSGGLPGLNQSLKIKAHIEDEGIETPDLSFVNKNFIQAIDSMINESGKTQEELEFERLLRMSEKGETFKDGVVDELIQLKGVLKPLPEGEVLSEDGYDVIKHAESNGRWNVSPSTSGAYGIFQFTEGTWRRVMSTPEGKGAGLTLGGRFQKNPKQQEAAMRILTKYNTAAMRRDKVTINIESIYFAHHFSPRHAAAVYNVDDKTRLPKSLLSKAVLKANPRLVKDKVKTAGDMKSYIRRALKRGEKSLTKTGR